MTQKKPQTTKNADQQAPPTYTMADIFKITDELFEFQKEKNYHPGAFIHGLIFTLEFAQHSYKIPSQQIAEIKRDCRRYVNEVIQTKTQNQQTPSKKK